MVSNWSTEPQNCPPKNGHFCGSWHAAGWKANVGNLVNVENVGLFEKKNIFNKTSQFYLPLGRG